MDESKRKKNKKYHLFTKAEMIMLSKTYIDYRNGAIEDLKENFTISNLKKDKDSQKDSSKNQNKNNWVDRLYRNEVIKQLEEEKKQKEEINKNKKSPLIGKNFI